MHFISIWSTIVVYWIAIKLKKQESETMNILIQPMQDCLT